MIQKAVAQFASLPNCEATHLPFFFTADVRHARKAGWRKLGELVRVFARLLAIRRRGAIDLLIYPTGGPQTVPIVRDILLLPAMLLCARRVVLHFHAAGVSERCAGNRGSLVCRLLTRVYRRVSGAIVMAEFNRRDPEFFGIRDIIVRPHRIPDHREPALLSTRRGPAKHLLYVGHLHPDKGTDALLRAVAVVRRDDPEVTLELVGEPLPPWSEATIPRLIRELGIEGAVTTPGVLIGDAKAAAFARANLFVFPTVAPYESFGLVLAEAMMWELPIIASRWRGNEDVLASSAGATMFPVEQPLDRQISHALTTALAAHEIWPQWGRVNRDLFERRYKEEPGDPWFANAVTRHFANEPNP
jgi:glycosyltransferase involved in cell wall biosynthesis